LGGATVKGGGEVLRGSAGGVVVREPLKYKPRREPIIGRRGNRVDPV
jgi:hypothetical protein